jgi:HEPN domain-containing protein
MNGQIDREADVREWLTYARADRQAANTLFEAGLYGACACHCQQAVEKLLKAAIVAETGKRPPYEHNLWMLRQQLALDLPERIERHLATISPHYITSRYPVGVEVGYDETSVKRLLARVERVFQWFSSQLNWNDE